VVTVGAALQHGAALVHVIEAAQITQKEASTGAETTKQQEAEGVTVGETSVAKTDEAAPAEADEAMMAEAGKADEQAVPTITERPEAALMSPPLENQPGGHGEEREVHTISSDEPPRPHGKVVMDAEMSSTTEMAPRVCRGARSRGELDPRSLRGQSVDCPSTCPRGQP
jgi:hypothetical protein